MSLLGSEDDAGGLAADVDRGNKVGQQSGLDVPPDDDDASVVLESDRHEAAIGADAELPGDASASRELLDLGEGSRGVVDLEGEDGVRDDLGAVGRVEVGDLQNALAPG